MSTSSSHATVTYTSVSNDNDLPPWGFHLVEADEPEAPPSPVPTLAYPKYLTSSDDEVLAEDQPLHADASPTADSPGYIANSELIKDDFEEDLEMDPIDYADDDYEEEEHLAPTDSALPVSDFIPSSEEIEPFETDESAATPPPPRSPHTVVPFSQTKLRRAQISVRPHTPPSPSTEAGIAEYVAAPTPPSPPPSSLSPLSSHSPGFHPRHYYYHLPDPYILALPMLVCHWATEQPWFS
ncbi:hypothetical protein Tco_0758781 [Tanacetum coccineum]